MNWDYIFDVLNENIDLTNENFKRAGKEIKKLKKSWILGSIAIVCCLYICKRQEDSILMLKEENIEDDNNITELKEEIKELKESKE